MCLTKRELALVLAIAISLVFCSQAHAQSPTITSLSQTSGTVGTSITINGSNFGSTQGTSTVAFNGTSATPTSWSGTSIVAPVPTGAATGNVVVTVSSASNGLNFYVAQTVLGSWQDVDMGSVGTAGSASYSNGVFTVAGAGAGIAGTADNFNFLFQSLSGDGTIIARVLSVSGGTSPQAGVMIRETLAAGATEGSTLYLTSGGGSDKFYYRTSTNGSISNTSGGGIALPFWVKLVRSSSTFSAYRSSDAISWVQIGSSQTITMATNVYVGLGVTGGASASLATATFDNVSIGTPTTAAPAITSVVPDGGIVGSQSVISGSGFGASQGSSIVTLADVPVTVNSWSDTSITITIPTGAVSGLLSVSVASSMNSSNAVTFLIGTQPLSGWTDVDIGSVGVAGSASYSNGIFTVSGAGAGIPAGTNSDALNFLFQSLSGDGTIIARVLSTSGGTSPQVGIMIRETLFGGATEASENYQTTSGGTVYFYYRTSTDGNDSDQSGGGLSLPYWLKLVRSGNTFSAYRSNDQITWHQTGTSETITMATNVYVGLGVTSGTTSSATTATFDEVSISTATTPAPAITSILPDGGIVGTQAVISGSGFGTSQGSSVVTLADVPVTVNSWSNTSITITIPTGAVTGLMSVSVAPSMMTSNGVTFVIGSQPLSGWTDADIGSVGVAGSASYSSGVFTVSGAGTGIATNGNPDGLNFLFQSLSGDGTIVARVLSESGGTSPQVGVMIRETLFGGATEASENYQTTSGGIVYFYYRTSTDGNNTNQSGGGLSLPYWFKLVRSGNTFSSYRSANGLTWNQTGTTQTITMATNVYVGLGVTSGTTSSATTATFDNVSINTASSPAPIITSLSVTEGPAGTPVVITGSGFGATQGSSVVLLSDASVSVSTWSNTSISATIPTGGVSGPVAVLVGPSMNASNPVYFTIAAQITPVISSLAPSSGPVGSSVLIIGSGFGTSQGSSTVQFHGLTATVTSWSPTNVFAVVPLSTTTGPVTLTLGSDSITSNGVTFTITTELLSITAVAPSAGPPGTPVMITGTGFGALQSGSTVTFNGAAATVTSWTDTVIMAVVPSAATNGPVHVNTATGPTFTVSSTTTLTDSLSNSTTYTSVVIGGRWYSSNSLGSGCSSCTLRGTISNQFDSFGDITSTTDPLGYVTNYAFDSNYDVTSVQQPSVGGSTPTTSYTYNSFGEVLTMTDPLGKVTTNTYDSHGNLTSVTTPAPGGGASASVTSFAYNSLGELTQITDPLSNVTTMTYTSAGLIYTITDPQSNVTTYAYDSRGNRTSITDPQSHVTSFAYDAGNRLTTITYPDTTTSSFTYDIRGRRLTATDQNSKTTTYAYDDADRLTSVTDPASNVTNYTYDTENNLLSIEDANTHNTSFTYDAYGRVTKTTFPSSYYETYSYDADNNLTSKTDRKSQTINYVYDALNRLSSKTYPDTTAVDYTYDLVSKVTQVSDPTGTYGLSYDNMGRLTGTSTQYSFLSGTYTNAYSYDAASNRTGYTAPDSSTNTYSYDTLNRLTTLDSSWAGSFGFSYDSLNRRTQMTRPNSITTNYTYDSLSRLLSVLHQSGGSTIDGASYTLDSAGNRTAKADQYASITSNYTYDPLYELTQVTQASATTESYSYDPVGNRTVSLGVSSYTTNSSNEMTANSNASYTYDYNGNTTSKTVSSGTTNYTWDYENRLASVTLPSSGGTVSFKYDPFGRRIQKVFTTGTTTTTNYLYDGDNDIEELNASGVILARYTQTENLDEPLAESRSSTTSFYEADGLGSVSSLTNASGTVANSYTYDSFGNLTASSGSIANPYQYTGRDYDSETGLYYYRARYYDAGSGHFLSEDPTEFDGGLDFYTYVTNNSPNWADPNGLQRGGAAPVLNPAPASPPPSLGPILVPDPIQPSIGDVFLNGIKDILGDLVGAVGVSLANPVDLNPNEPDPSSFPKPRTIPQPDCPRRGCTCTCRADADATMRNNIKQGVPLFAFGTATASTCAQAAKDAKRIATRALGMKPKHIPCKCSN